MITLHSYILRELLKTFGLTLVALTVLFTMGGGLYNVVRYEGVSAGDVFGFIPLLIPIVVTLTMPMAALFAATTVYGRLAADNELLACRAAGVNVHRTFLSTILLSVFVVAFTLLFGNFIIPSFMQRIENFARSNVRDLVAQKLQHEGFIDRGKQGQDRFTVTAERVQPVHEDALLEKGFEVADGLHYLLITNATFLQTDPHGDLLRFVVARYVLCVFDTRPEQIEVTFHVKDGQNLEVGKRAVSISQQQIGPFTPPMKSPERLSMSDLRKLLHWRRAPWDGPRLRDDVRAFLDDFSRFRFFVHCRDRLADGQAVRLIDTDGKEYRLTCDVADLTHRGLALGAARVEIRAADQTLRTAYEAARVDLNATVLPSRHAQLEIRLVQTDQQDVLEYRPGAPHDGEPRHQPTLSLDLTLAPEVAWADVEEFTPAVVVNPAVPLPTNAHFDERRLGLQKAARRMERRVAATINFRLGYTASVLVTLLMGAALGVIFRGARVLAAFALAMIPFFSVTILMVLGRQLTEDEQTTAVGPLVTWGGLVLVLVADGLILRLGVRR